MIISEFRSTLVGLIPLLFYWEQNVTHDITGRHCSSLQMNQTKNGVDRNNGISISVIVKQWSLKMKNIKYLIVFTVIYFTRYHFKSSELYWKIKESYFSENFSV